MRRIYLAANTANPVSFEITVESGIPVLAHEFSGSGDAVPYTFPGHASEMTLPSDLPLETTYFMTEDPSVFLSERALVSSRLVAMNQLLEIELASASAAHSSADVVSQIIVAASEAYRAHWPPPAFAAATAAPPEHKTGQVTLPLWVLFATFVINGLSAVFAWMATLISYQRGKADQVLKNWQIAKLQIEVAQLHKKLERDASEMPLTHAMP